uniref:G-protein coupled receptors family 1 profile domain-containing protein n=1 Tax=Anopheles atroparvus TaxID=41427 RepID=A0A182JD84_ANOAO
MAICVLMANETYREDWSGNGSCLPTAAEPDVEGSLNVPYALLEGMVALMAIFGNTLVILAFKRERRLRRRTNFYIISLASADLLVGTLGIPFAVLASIGLPRNLHACLFTISLLVVLCTISIFCLVAVSIDRYWAILHPLAYSRNMRTKTTLYIISVCWVVGSVIGFLPLFGWHEDPDVDACLFVKVMNYDYLVFLYLVTIIIPAVLLLAFYIHIYRVIVRQRQQILSVNSIDSRFGASSRASLEVSKSLPDLQLGRDRCVQQTSRGKRKETSPGQPMLRVLRAAQNREVKATQNLSIIVLFFMICWMPLHTINCIVAFCPQCHIHAPVMLFVITLSHLNSALNPLLYAYHLKDFRTALKRLILAMFGLAPAVNAHQQHPDCVNCISALAHHQHPPQHLQMYHIR